LEANAVRLGYGGIVSLLITNKATPRQLELLATLEYTGTGKYAADKLTADEAGKIIDELIIERRYTNGEIQAIAGDYYNMPIAEVAGSSPEEYSDPFSNRNKLRSK
jgi:hypothetical protein